MQCPKCAYVRQPTDTASEYECPKCGIIYAKYDPVAEERLRLIAERRRKAADQERSAMVRSAVADPEYVPEEAGEQEYARGVENASKISPREDCGRSVSVRADRCLHCGGPVAGAPPTRVQVADIDMAFWSMVKFMVKWVVATIPALIILVAVAAFAIGFLGGFGGFIKTLGVSSDAKTSKLDDVAAWTKCQAATKAVLKSPASASFDNSTILVTRISNGFNVTGSVDSQNSFGAMIRSEYECDLEISGGALAVKHIGIDGTPIY